MKRALRVAELPSLAGRTAVVTGATSGIGLETAAALAGAGARVILPARDRHKAQSTLDALRARHTSATVETMALDLADLSSIRAFADTFSERCKRLDILCNNAGVMTMSDQRTRDGFESQIGTNHLGHFALTGLLLPHLQATPGARIVSVSSLGHRGIHQFDPDDLNYDKRAFDRFKAYGISKLANLLFAFELDRRLRRTGSAVLSVAAHPGISATNLLPVGQDTGRWSARLFNAFNHFIAPTAADGARPSLYAATAADIHGGEYIGPSGLGEIRGAPARAHSTALARDPQIAARLWAVSEQLTSVSYLS